MSKLLLQSGDALLKQDGGFLLLMQSVDVVADAVFIMKRRRR